MFRAVRITVLLVVLLVVGLSSWLTRFRSTDWNNSLWVKVYPVNADGSALAEKYIRGLRAADFEDIEQFVAREVGRWGKQVARPVRMELGEPVLEQPPQLPDNPGALDVMLWSLRLRWWSSSVTDSQDHPAPDVRIFVRYHEPADELALDNSVGLQKGMVGIVNAYAGRSHQGANNVIIAHEFLHTLGATDKYDPATGNPLFPHGFAAPERVPRFPQRQAEIMGGRIAVSEREAVIPSGLAQVVIGPQTATEIRLRD